MTSFRRQIIADQEPRISGVFCVWEMVGIGRKYASLLGCDHGDIL